MNKPSVAPADCKGDDRGDPALTKWCYRFDSWLVWVTKAHIPQKNGFALGARRK